MHILLIHQYFQEKDDPGGLRWNEMARLWAKEGHKITVIAGMTHYSKGIRNPKYNNKYVYEDAFAENIKVIRTHVSDSYNNNFRGRLKAYFSFVFSGMFGGLFKAREKYDLILVSSPPLSVGFVAIILSLFKRVPLLFEVRDIWPESAIETGIIKNKLLINLSYKLERSIYKKAKLINVVTPAMKELLIKQKNIAPEKIICIPNAADFNIADNLSTQFDRTTFRKQLGIDDKLILCYVGAHGFANHLIQVLDTAELLKTEPIVFILIGDGMQKNMLIETTRSRNLSNILFFDSVAKEEALKYIIASDIGISVLKKIEIFKTVYSNKTFDYMACKKPILMAIDGISKELVEQSEAGLFVIPENHFDFAAKIRYYLQNRTLIIKHGENGYNYAKKHFDRKDLALSYLKLIEQLLQKPGSKTTLGSENSTASDVQ